MSNMLTFFGRLRDPVAADLDRYYAKEARDQKRDEWISNRANYLLTTEYDPFSDSNIEEGISEFVGNLSKAEGVEFGRQIRDDPCAAGMALRAGVTKYWRDLAESRADTEYEPGGE